MRSRPEAGSTPMSNSCVPYSAITQARRRIDGCVRVTPLENSPSLSALLETPVLIKCEHHQLTGSFKLRGATNAILSLDRGQKKRGVVGASTGNHGRALAHAARREGMACIICMSALVPANKVEAIRSAGADVLIVGASQDDAQAEVDRLVAEDAMVAIPPFDHEHVIAGQGTLGLEILDQCPEAVTLVVPLSGGGLISGIAMAAKTKRPDMRIIGVCMDRGPAMHASQKAGKPVVVEELASIADSLGGGIGLHNTYTFNMVRDLVDDIVLLNEAEIFAGINHAYWSEGEIVEGAGAVAIGAVLAGRIKTSGPVVLVASGKNIDMKQHHRMISGQGVAV